MAAGDSVKVRVAARGKETLKLKYRQKGSALTGFDVTGFDPPALAADRFMLVLNIRRLTLELVEKAHADDLKVIGWTVNTPDHLKLVRGLRLDGATTDFPEIRRAARFTA